MIGRQFFWLIILHPSLEDEEHIFLNSKIISNNILFTKRGLRQLDVS